MWQLIIIKQALRFGEVQRRWVRAGVRSEKPFSPFWAAGPLFWSPEKGRQGQGGEGRGREGGENLQGGGGTGFLLSPSLWRTQLLTEFQHVGSQVTNYLSNAK